MSINDIHYFPGHMKKSLNQIKEKLKDCDGVIELFDARAIKSSFPFNLDNLIINKIKIMVIAKSDLADENKIKKSISHFKEQFSTVFSLNVKDPQNCKKMIDYLNTIKTNKDEKYLKMGFPITKKRYMILGIPNVGKSTLINSLCKKYKAQVENRPGKTKSETLIQVSKYIEIYDTPGVLLPNYEDKEVACKLALIGSLKIENSNKIVLSDYAFNFFINNYPQLLKEKYRFNNEDLTSSYEELLTKIAKNKNLMLTTSKYDIERARDMFLKDIRNGTIGRFSFDV